MRLFRFRLLTLFAVATTLAGWLALKWLASVEPVPCCGGADSGGDNGEMDEKQSRVDKLSDERAREAKQVREVPADVDKLTRELQELVKQHEGKESSPDTDA